MPFEEVNKGGPFQGDFPGWPDREPSGDQTATVQCQVDELAHFRYEPTIRHQNVTLLQRWWQPELGRSNRRSAPEAHGGHTWQQLRPPMGKGGDQRELAEMG
jgi:hypothetical protein